MLNIFADALMLATRMDPLPPAHRRARPELRDDVLETVQDRPRRRSFGQRLLGL